jgi:hypothetical protein
MNDAKQNLEIFSLLTSIYDIESNTLTYIKNKFQNFLLSINGLFINNNWYNNNILKYINYILSKKVLPLILSCFIFIKSKLTSFKFISEDFLNINIQNKNKLILFLLLNSFETLIIKYIDTFFSYCYKLFFNSSDNIEKVKYYGKCTKNIFKNFMNIQNIIFGMNYYRSLAPVENKNIFRGFEKPIKFFGYGFIMKNVYNIFNNAKNIYNIYCLTGEKNGKNNKDKFDKFNTNKIIKEDEEEDDDKENVCLLCLNKYSNTCCTPCGHLFCWSCIHLYLIRKDTCPKCKIKIKPQDIIFLQNYDI